MARKKAKKGSGGGRARSKRAPAPPVAEVELEDEDEGDGDEAETEAGDDVDGTRPANGRRRQWTIVSYAELDKWRKEQKLTKIGLAKRLGVTNSTIHNWARGDSVPNPNTQLKIRQMIDGTVPADRPWLLGTPMGSEGAPAPVPAAAAGATTVATTAAEIVNCYMQTQKGALSPDQLGKLVREVCLALTS